jgi:alpha-acetolactate decarboxylase
MEIRTIVLLGMLAGPPAAPPLETHGTVRRLIQAHDLSAKVELAEVLREPHAHGIGSLSGLRGEITILDGTVWLSYPPALPSQRPAVISTKDSPESAAFLAVTHVPPDRWRKLRIEQQLSSDNLDAAIERLVADGGGGGRSFAFRIDGTFPSLTVATIDGRRLTPGDTSEASMKGANVLEQLGPVQATLVGFHSADGGGGFTHPGTRNHAHVIVPDKRATGHARAFTVLPGATLWFATTR